MGTEATGINTSIVFDEKNVKTDEIGGHRYVLFGDVKYVVPSNDPVDLDYAASDRINKWRNGIINIGFGEGVDAAKQANVRAAFDMWAPAGITFVEDSGGVDIAIFVRSNSDQSNMGRVGGKQSVEISRWNDITTIAHEIGHLIGLEHEQQRSDRDSHIAINSELVINSLADQFAINRNSSLITKYDLGSIMHYGQEFPKEYYISKIVEPVFHVLNKNEAPGHKIGYPPRPSKLDIQGVKKIYASEIT